MRNIKQIHNEKLLMILKEFSMELENIYGKSLKDIILYGSYARGDFDNESDLDIMVLIDKDEKELREYYDKLISKVTEFSLKYDIVLSVVDKNADDFSKYIEYVPFYKNVYNEGVEIYAG